MIQGLSLRRDGVAAVAKGLAWALAVGLALALAAHSPRARLKVMQAIAALLFAIIIVRHARARAPVEREAAAKEGQRGLLLAVCLAGAVCAYTLSVGFISDDYSLLWSAREPVLESLKHLLTRGMAGTFFRPAVFASFLADHAVWGEWSPGFHLTNLLLHLACGAAVFFLCKSLGSSLETGLEAALIFYVLPIQAEALPWMASRFDLLATCFGIWSLWFYVRFRRAGRPWHYGAALALFLFAMLSKESAYILPFLVLALESLVPFQLDQATHPTSVSCSIDSQSGSRDPSRRVEELLAVADRRIKPALSFLVLAALSFSYRWAVLGGIGGYRNAAGRSAALEISLKTFEGLFLRAPAQLLLGYNWLQPNAGGTIVIASLTAGFLLAIALSTQANRLQSRIVWLGLVWMLAGILPAYPLLLIDAGLTNSRVLYLASVGLAMVIAVLLTEIRHVRMRRVCTLLLAFLFSLGLIHNLEAWRNAGQLSQRFLVELRQLEPQPPPHAEFVLLDMPDRIRGAFFFRAGLPEAVRIAYGREDVTARREGEPASSQAGNPVIMLRWKPRDGALLERVAPAPGEGQPATLSPIGRQDRGPRRGRLWRGGVEECRPYFWHTMFMMESVFLVSAVRTPIGKFGGALAGHTAADMGAVVARAALERARVPAGCVDEVIFGNARQAGGGPNPARQIGYRAGVPESVPAFTVNQACASGLKSIVLGCQEILLGRARCVVAGGTESMSRLPYYLEGARWGMKMGHQPLVDGMYRDGFLCPLSKMVMGETAEKLAAQYGIARQEQDAYALESQQRAERAIRAGIFREEIVPLEVARGKKTENFDTDEHSRFGTTAEALAKLEPVFSKQGSITAGNSSGITDGAAATVLASESAVREWSLEPLAHVVDYAAAGVDPSIMGIGPVPAVRKLLARTRLRLEDFGLVELNEAFAAQVLACDRDLHFDRQRLNVNGGAIALGHPIGASGARIVVTLVNEMRRRQVNRGLATLCVSGGMGLAVAFEKA